MRTQTPGWLLVLIGTLVTASFSLYNNFPFLYPDSAAYLESGILQRIPADRPVFYGLFLRVCHMMSSLFICVLVQSALMAYVAYLPFGILKPKEVHGPWYILVIFVLTLCTSWSFFAGYLMPDFFGIILFISVWLLFFFPLSKKHTVVLLLLAVAAILVHQAHLILFVFLMLFYFIFSWVTGRQPIPRKRAGILTLSTLALFLAVTFITNATMDKATDKGSSSVIFLTSRLNEAGILHEFLQRKCGTQSYPLCMYKDSLTADFLWDTRSPMYKVGGWNADREEYRRMLKGMMTDFRTIERIMVMSFTSTLQQFFSFELEPHHPLKLSYIRESFKMHRHDMDISFQNRGGRLNFTSLNSRQLTLVMTSFFLFVILWMRRSALPSGVLGSIVFLMTFLWINAWIFGTFSTVLTRYQGRIISLVPFIAMFWLPEVVESVRHTWESLMKKSSDPN